MKRIRIAYLVDDLSYGGAQKQLVLLVRALPERFEPLVVSLSENTDPFAGVLRADGIAVTTLVRRSHADLGRLLQLKRSLAGARVDVVHGWLEASNAYGFLAAKMLGKPLVLSLQSDRLGPSALRGGVLSWMLRRADRLTVNSRAGLVFLTKRVRVRSERVMLVSNWVDSSRVAAGPRAEPTNTVGFVGRLSAEKRVEVLIQAFALLLSERPDARLVLMGEGKERDALERRVRALGIGDKVEWLAPSPDVESVLSRLDCFVLPSVFEGLPNAVIEALAVGVPVVASRVGDLPELVIGGKTGRLVDDGSATSFAAAIANVLDDRTLRETVRTEGPKLIRDRFAIERALEQLVPMYEELVSRREANA